MKKKKETRKGEEKWKKGRREGRRRLQIGRKPSRRRREERDKVKDRERERRREGETWRRRGKRELSSPSPSPPLQAATTAEASSFGVVPCRRPVAIASSLLEIRERERKNDGKRRTKGCLRFVAVDSVQSKSRRRRSCMRGRRRDSVVVTMGSLHSKETPPKVD
ncbi:hypothetical protein PIB30_053542 [Stylosanthes scabra]|uniref:Uncharacterized protein n=1 Tax=Stylosanthes scabra TaxID=79078 RepID=A0ABU6XGR3_9FABA|nr:hypothetical protein [Stylosanthes scabra]